MGYLQRKIGHRHNPVPVIAGASGVFGNSSSGNRHGSQRWFSVLAGGFAVALLAGCGSGGLPAPAGAPPGPVQATAADGRGAMRPIPAPTACTTTVTSGPAMTAAVAAARPGQRICLKGNMSAASVRITNSGTAQAPIAILGDGNATVADISVLADHVDIEGINAVGPNTYGISINGTGITLRNNTWVSPGNANDTGIGFWGTDLTITHNTVRDNSDPNGAHANCIQTTANSVDNTPSKHVVIDSNRCEQINNSCLAIIGPSDTPYGGYYGGQTANITYSNNFCENRAPQAVLLNNAQDISITGNQFTGNSNANITLRAKSTGVKVSNNTVDGGTISVDTDHASSPGYQGPAAKVSS